MTLHSARFLTVIMVFSLTLNLLTLASPIFMMQVYDRVMTSHSLPTLVALFVIVAVLQATQSLLHYNRALVLRRYAAHIDETFEEAAFEETVAPQMKNKTWDGETTPLQHLANHRTYVAGNGLTALFDVPWAVMFTVVMFLLHPWLGMLALAFTICIAAASIAAHAAGADLPTSDDKATPYRAPFRDAVKVLTIRGYGLTGRFKEEWLKARDDGRSQRADAQIVPDVFRTFARGLKNIQGSAILALAAYLTLENMATFGVMMASSIIAGRMSAPVEALVTSWKDIRAARTSRTYLQALEKLHQSQPRKKDLPPPARSIELVRVSAGPASKPILSAVAFKFSTGDAVGIIGPTGAGKSSLINVLAGVIVPRAGRVTFDDVEQPCWPEKTLGAAIGYLPQDIVFFDGTIAENIARFDPRLDDREVIAAANSIGIHETIQDMPDGYDTRIVKFGQEYSASFRVKLGLARAFYRRPFLLLLDNPTGSFDHDGDKKLTAFLKAHKARGGILIIATNHLPALMLVDQVVVLNQGKIKFVGGREQLFKPVSTAQIQPKTAVDPGYPQPVEQQL